MADQHTLTQALTRNFLGHSPNWYKLTIIGFLVLNPILFQIDEFGRFMHCVNSGRKAS